MSEKASHLWWTWLRGSCFSTIKPNLIAMVKHKVFFLFCLTQYQLIIPLGTD
jgi:hypothetical protein